MDSPAEIKEAAKKSEDNTENLEDDEDAGRQGLFGCDKNCEMDEDMLGEDLPDYVCPVDKNSIIVDQEPLGGDIAEGYGLGRLYALRDNIEHRPDRNCPSLAIPTERQREDRIELYLKKLFL